MLDTFSSLKKWGKNKNQQLGPRCQQSEWGRLHRQPVTYQVLLVTKSYARNSVKTYFNQKGSVLLSPSLCLNQFQNQFESRTDRQSEKITPPPPTDGGRQTGTEHQYALEFQCTF